VSSVGDLLGRDSLLVVHRERFQLCLPVLLHEPPDAVRRAVQLRSTPKSASAGITQQQGSLSIARH